VIYRIFTHIQCFWSGLIMLPPEVFWGSWDALNSNYPQPGFCTIIRPSILCGLFFFLISKKLSWKQNLHSLGKSLFTLSLTNHQLE